MDADAINTFKKGWRGKDDIEYPQYLRQALVEQFTDNKLDEVPKTYGELLRTL